MPLYILTSGKVAQFKPVSDAKEQELQILFEDNLESLLGVRFVATDPVAQQGWLNKVITTLGS